MKTIMYAAMTKPILMTLSAKSGYVLSLFLWQYAVTWISLKNSTSQLLLEYVSCVKHHFLAPQTYTFVFDFPQLKKPLVLKDVLRGYAVANVTKYSSSRLRRLVPLFQFAE
jgi:hypothetical protein